MLSNDQIVSFTKSSNITKNILQEYLQHELLDSFYKQSGSENYSFIGGTAIRIVYGGKRFSEDLDFDTTDLESFDRILSEVVEDMKYKGFNLEFRLIHKGAYHCHIKFPKILQIHGLSGYDEEKLLVKFDASNTDILYSQKNILNNYGVFQTINVAPPSILLSKKLLTIQSRKRPKGRDLYDVTWLWGMAKPDESYIRSNTNKDLHTTLQELLQYVITLDLDDLSKQTSIFLEQSSELSRILNFPSFIEQKIKEL